MIPRHFQITIGLLLLAILFSGIVIIQLRQREQANAQPEGLSVSAPMSGGKPERIRILVAYDGDQALRWRVADALMPTDPASRAREAMQTLLAQYLESPSPHPLAKGTDIKDVYLIGNDTLIVDTTAPFADGHPSGILREELTLVSLIETVSANVAGVKRVKFLVDGKERETLAGHADLISFYQTSAIH
ncbi:MAG: GerMN domain-containing protein, partial [Candidatus Angelobacter sp.]